MFSRFRDTPGTVESAAASWESCREVVSSFAGLDGVAWIPGADRSILSSSTPSLLLSPAVIIKTVIKMTRVQWNRLRMRTGAPWFGEGQNSGVGRVNGRCVPEVLTCCVVTENNRTEKYDGLSVAKKLVLLPRFEWIVLQGRVSQNLTCVYHLKIF